MFAGDYQTAKNLLDEARTIAVSTGDTWNLAMTLVIRGVMEVLRSEPMMARQHLMEALEVARAVGDPRPVSMALTYLGLIALTLGEATNAERFAREAHVLAAEHEDRFQMSLSLQVLGRIAIARSEPVEADWLLSESLGIAREIGDRWLEAQALGCQGELAARQGDYDRARARRRSALATAAAAPQPIALDELAGLAELEIDERPTAALVALIYMQQHPLTRPTTRARVADKCAETTRSLSPEQLTTAEIAAKELSLERPAALLDLLRPL
jgi:tetratricopeptide (TPR) repeat protein